jgi:spore germination cell wall hydrolase CwlJ-like protein
METVKRMMRFAMATAAVMTATYTEAESVDILAKTLYYEARGEGETGIRAVASVLQNRAIKRYGKATGSLCAAEAKRKMQFSCWNGKKDLPKGKEKAAWELCSKVAKEMVGGTFKATHTYTHYYAYNLCNPKWANGVAGLVIGNHKFLSVRGKS